MNGARRILFLFFGASCLAYVATSAGIARANARREGASMCMPVAFNYTNLYLNGWGSWVHTGTTQESVICPFVDDTTLPKGSVTNLYEEVYDYSSGASGCGQACSAFWDGVGGNCEANPTCTTALYAQQLNLPHTSWTNSLRPYDFPFVYVTLNGTSVFMGFSAD
jgi:hypothetical protein